MRDGEAVSTVKQRILEAVARGEPIDDSLELQGVADTDQHNIIHVLHAMSRQGLVTFKLRRVGRAQHVTKIRLGRRGRAAMEENRPV